jgi:hypothetical protein
VVEVDNSFFGIISKISDIVSIVLFTYGIIYALFRKTRSVIGFQINQFMIKSFRLGVIMVIGIFLFHLSVFPYTFIILMLKQNTTSFLWEKGKELQHIGAYFITAAIMLPIFWMITSTIWTLSLKYVIDFVNLFLPMSLRFKVDHKPVLEILHAEYGTQKNRIDVTEKLRTMVNNNSLIITASNELAGDPDIGTVKALTIDYRYNDKVFTEQIYEKHTKTIPC